MYAKIWFLADFNYLEFYQGVPLHNFPVPHLLKPADPSRMYILGDARSGRWCIFRPTHIRYTQLLTYAKSAIQYIRPNRPWFYSSYMSL